MITSKPEIEVKTPETPKLPNISGASDVSSGDEKPKNKGGRPRKSSAGIQPNRSDLKPFFQTISMVIESFHGEKLSETEIDSGCDAWFPVWEKYYPMITDKAIWLPGTLWSFAVIAPRVKSSVQKRKEKTEK